MSTVRNKILEKRKRLEIQKEKNEARLKAIQLKLKKTSQRIAKDEKKDDLKRKMILGNFMLEKVKRDPSFKSWLEGEILPHLKNPSEIILFKNVGVGDVNPESVDAHVI